MLDHSVDIRCRIRLRINDISQSGYTFYDTFVELEINISSYKILKKLSYLNNFIIYFYIY